MDTITSNIESTSSMDSPLNRTGGKANKNDERIEELIQLMNTQGKHLEMLTDRATQLVNENKLLREGQIIAMQSSVTSSSETSKSKEKRLLRDQCVLLSKELENANNAIALKDKELAEISKISYDSANIISTLESKLHALETEKRDLQLQVSKEITTTSRFRKIVEDTHSFLKQSKEQVLILTDKLKDKENERVQIRNEVDDINKFLKISIQEKRQLRERIDMIIVQHEATLNNLNDAKKELRSLAVERDEYASMNEQLENQLRVLRKTITYDRRAINEAKSQLEEALLAKDANDLKRTHLEKYIESQLKAKQMESSEILSSTKNSINKVVANYEQDKVKYEKDKNELIREKNRVEYDVRLLRNELSEIKSQRDSFQKLLDETVGKLQTVTQQMKENDTKFIENKKRLAEVEKESAKVKQYSIEIRQQKNDIEHTLEKERIESREKLSKSDVTITNLNHTISKLSNELTKVTEKMKDISQTKGNEIELLQGKMNALQSAAVVREKQMGDEMKQRDLLMQQIEENYKDRIEKLQNEQRETMSEYDKKFHDIGMNFQVSHHML